MRVGIALKPSTKLETILPYVKDVDMVRGLSLFFFYYYYSLLFVDTCNGSSSPSSSPS